MLLDRRLLLAYAVALAVVSAAAEAPAQPPAAKHVGATPLAPWEAWEVSRDDAAPVALYVQRDAERRPVVVMLPGSHCVPLFWFKGQGAQRTLRSSLVFEALGEAPHPGFHLAAVERRRLSSFVDDRAIVDDCSPEHGGVSKEERARDAADAVTALRAEPWVSEVILLGHSEGADVAAAAAKLLSDGDLAAVGFLSSGGSSLFFGPVARARHEGDARAAQAGFDDLLTVTAPSPPARYKGSSLDWFRSFTLRSTPADDLRGLHVPVFIAHGTCDRNSAIESADQLAIELLRTDSARPVHYLVLDGLDHGYLAPDAAPHQREVFDAFLAWAVAPTRTRGVETRAFATSCEAPAPRFIVRYLGVRVEIWEWIGIAAGAIVAVLLVRRWLTRRRGKLVGT